MKVKILKLDNYGRGITYINDKICFVFNALPDEIVKIQIVKENSKIMEAKVVEYIETSPKRYNYNCPYKDVCGGCSVFNLSLEDENEFKLLKVKQLLEKYTNIDSSIVTDIVSSSLMNYRNKITLHGNNNELGLYKYNSNDLLPIDKCLLVNESINKIISLLIKHNINISNAVIKSSNNEENILVNIKGEISNIDEFLKYVDVLVINDKYISKNKSILTNIGDMKFYVSSDSFFQVNQYLTKSLYDEVLNVLIDVRPNKVLDLYCGTGTIGIYVSKYCNEVIGIDYNESNINDAFKNKTLNNVTNISFINDKVENRIDTFKDIDFIIVDPPRSGLDKKTREYLSIINPNNIVYVSCDPITLVRDLNVLSNNYNVRNIKLFNMFPRTYHVESVVVLERR